MISKRFKLLRRTMFENGVEQVTLGKSIGRCPGYISARLNGRMPFDAEDMYKILNYFDIPHNQMHEFFPPHGLEEKK